MTQIEELAALHDAPGFWYLAHPYTKYPGGLDAAYVSACAMADRFTRAGIRHYSPIKVSHGVARDTGLDARDPLYWLIADEPYMKMAHGIVIAGCPGWDTSDGIAHEISYFAKARKPAYRYVPRDYWWGALSVATPCQP